MTTNNINSVNNPAHLAKPVYEVLAHTPDILVVQTHAGMPLSADVSIKTAGKTDECGQAADNCAQAADNKQAQHNSFGRFNLGLHVNDAPQRVLQNRAHLLASINDYLLQEQSKDQGQEQSPPISSLYWLNQIHSNKVVRVDHAKGDSGLSLAADNADALITDQAHTALAIMTADCVPIAIYDPASQQVAAIHAGWQGLANGVIASTYAQLSSKNPLSTKGELDSKPDASSDLPNPSTQAATQALVPQAWIGACISQPCYEVSTEVVEKLLAGCHQMGMDTESIRAKIVGQHDNPNKAWLDLPLLAALQLQMLGIEVNHIEQQDSANQDKESEDNSLSPAYACSYRHPYYYSYRQMTHAGQANTGRMALLVMRLR